MASGCYYSSLKKIYDLLTHGEKFSRGFIFASNLLGFFYISCVFNFADWLPVDFSRGFIFANLNFINVFIYFDFFVVCSSANSMWVNYSQILTLDYEMGWMGWTNWWAGFLYPKISEILYIFWKLMLINLIQSCLVCILHGMTGIPWI